MAECFVVDVGHGNAAVFVDGGSCAVVDCAPSKAVIDLLRGLGLSTISALFISHSDYDHVGGAVSLLSTPEITIQTIYVAPDAIKTTDAWWDFRVALRDAQSRGSVSVIASLNAATPDEVGVGEFIFKVCFPTLLEALGGPGSTDNGHQVTGNDMSAVIRVVHAGEPVALCAADTTVWAFARLIASRVDVSAPILVFPHHGGALVPADVVVPFLQRVSPRFAVFSHGRRRFRNPRPEMVAIARRSGANVLCTQLSMHCSPGDKFAGRAPEFASAGSVAGLCCAGTVRFDIPVQDYSSSAPHRDFISLLPSPMCAAPLEKAPELV